MKKALSIGIFFAIIALLVQFSINEKKEGPDPLCVSHCTGRGFGAGYCAKRCSVDAEVQAQNAELADHLCMNRCTSAGQPEESCRKTCTY